MTVRSGKSKGTIEVTPSGIPVYYQSEPKRLYRIRTSKRWGSPVVNDEDREWLLGSAQRQTTEGAGGWAEEGWREVPSVTTVLGVLNKPALPWWGMKIGAEGVAILFNLGLVKPHIMPGGIKPVLCCPVAVKPDPEKGEKFVPWLDMESWVVAGQDQLADVLNVQQLTVNHATRKAGDRGQAVHDALESWAQTGELPDVSIYPPTQAGYVRGLVEFLGDVPSAEPVGSEILVASSEHGFAGRYDLRLRTTEEHNVVVHRTPKKGPVWRVLSPGEGITDLKTSKGVYPSHSRQLAGYEQASVESGYVESDWQGILHVSAEGEYEFKRSWATFEDFKVCLDVFNSDERMKLAERADRTRK